MLPKRIYRHNLFPLCRGPLKGAEIVGETGIDFRFLKLPALYRMHHFPRRMKTRVRHLDCGATLNPADMIVRAAPVRHDQAVVAPLFPENLEHELRIFIRLEPVHLVVTRHQRAGLSLFDRNLKAGQVNLPERSLVDLGVQCHAPEFL